TDRSRARRCVEACVYGTLDFVGYPRFPAPVEFIAAVIAYYVHPVNIQTACLIMEDRKSGSAGMPRPISYAVFCLKKKKNPPSLLLSVFPSYGFVDHQDLPSFPTRRSSDLTDRSRARRCVEACVYGTLDFVGYPRFPAPVEFIAAVIAYYVHPVNIQTACLIM